jgi:hypothetical protein
MSGRCSHILELSYPPCLLRCNTHFERGVRRDGTGVRHLLEIKEAEWSIQSMPEGRPHVRKRFCLLGGTCRKHAENKWNICHIPGELRGSLRWPHG